jgi:hypothetical protein
VEPKPDPVFEPRQSDPPHAKREGSGPDPTRTIPSPVPAEAVPPRAKADVPPPPVQPGEWQEFAGWNGRFRVQMPDRPSDLGPPTPPGQPARQGGLGLFSPEIELFALAGELDEGLPAGGPLGYLRQVVLDSLSENFNGMLRSQSFIVYRGETGKEFSVVVPGRTHARIRIIFVGTRYYLLGVGAEKAPPPEAFITRFFNSLRIGEDK